LAAVQAALSGLGLQPVVTEEFHEQVAAGSVIRVEPAAGTEVPRDSQVGVFVSKGKAPRAIPNVSGRSFNDAINVLTQAGFQISGVDGDPTRPVIATDPPAGEVQPYGTRVRIIGRRS